MDGGHGARSRLAEDVDIRYVELSLDKRQTLRNLARFLKVLRGVRPDLLLTYNWGAIEWGLVNRIVPQCRHVHMESGFGIEEADSQLWRRVLLRRIALARAAWIVVPSRSLVDIATGVWKLRADRIAYIPNGVDCAKFGLPPQAGIIEGFRKAPDELIVGTVAPLRAEKNLTRLIRAFAAVAGEFDTRLLIVGDGPTRRDLTSLAAELGVTDKVVFAGHVEEVERVLGWFDVFALSSNTEQMPNSLLQAMAAGRPIAGVDVGDVKLMVSPENRPFASPKGDDARFRETLMRLLAEPETRAELGRRNRAHVRAHYDQARMFSAYEAVFET
jgi:glycosyltransferase involved in cell wall biosynthesis